jgi:hypothetical protein
MMGFGTGIFRLGGWALFVTGARGFRPQCSASEAGFCPRDPLTAEQIQLFRHWMDGGFEPWA